MYVLNGYTYIDCRHLLARVTDKIDRYVVEQVYTGLADRSCDGHVTHYTNVDEAANERACEAVSSSPSSLAERVAFSMELLGESLPCAPM